MPDEVFFREAYRTDLKPTTGIWNEKSETVKRKVSAWTRNYNSMWIGITSNGEKGLRQRWNDKYKGLGMTQIAAVYETSSEEFRRKMEKELTEFYKEHADNVAPGGGGRNAGNPPLLVYVAWN